MSAPSHFRLILGILFWGWGLTTLPAERRGSLRIEEEETKLLLTQAPVENGVVHHLDGSSDLSVWRELAFSLSPYDAYVLPTDGEAHFYRVRSHPAEDRSDWTNQLDLFDGRIFTEPAAPGQPRTPIFAKFTTILEDPTRVYFQDSDRYQFHYHFARSRLPGYGEISYPDYERLSLFPDGQELLLGTVLLPPDPNLTELAIQFTGNEPFAIEEIARWFNTVRSRIVTPEGWRFFYLPAFEQQETAFANEAWLAQRGILVDTAARWITDNACYSNGWALGRLKYFAADEIDAAFGDGRLSYLDILVTDQVPAEIPLLAGVLVLAPATPNSHVAIQAKSFGIPFAHPSGRALQDQVLAMLEREILLVVSTDGGTCEISLQDVEGKLSPEERQMILESKQAPAVDVVPVAMAGRYQLDCAELTPDDIKLVGGKAANFGFLRRSIPGQSPDPAIALSFDLWNDFMAQPYGEGTLAESIAQELAPFTFPPDIAQLRPTLETIRNRIRKLTDFSGPQQSGIMDALAGFSSDRKIRFRSSTNVEDSRVFSGAGLYDSYSGCIADDTDGDELGPSHCDPTKLKERGVLRAIRKVYASFYNENAFIERLRHRIDESQVGMAILVHYSFPDELELANGVATMTIGKPADGPRIVAAQLVSQTGAQSITNPNGSALPEIVQATYDAQPAGALWTLAQASALLPDGESVLEWTDGYTELLALLDTAARAYEAWFPFEQILELDFEWKLVEPGSLIIKQIRRIPRVQPVPPPVIE